jgi:hypothetical protein
MQQFFSLLSWSLFTAQHLSGVFPPIIRSSMTAVAASGFTFVLWWQSCSRACSVAGNLVFFQQYRKFVFPLYLIIKPYFAVYRSIDYRAANNEVVSYRIVTSPINTLLNVMLRSQCSNEKKFTLKLKGCSKFRNMWIRKLGSTWDGSFGYICILVFQGVYGVNYFLLLSIFLKRITTKDLFTLLKEIYRFSYIRH